MDFILPLALEYNGKSFVNDYLKSRILKSKSLLNNLTVNVSPDFVQEITYKKPILNIDTLDFEETTITSKFECATISINAELENLDWKLIAIFDNDVSNSKGKIKENRCHNIISKKEMDAIPGVKVYKTQALSCEHCNTNRKRNQLFLLQAKRDVVSTNADGVTVTTKKDEFRTVGSSCFEVYTGITQKAADELINIINMLKGTNDGTIYNKYILTDVPFASRVPSLKDLFNSCRENAIIAGLMNGSIPYSTCTLEEAKSNYKTIIDTNKDILKSSGTEEFNEMKSVYDKSLEELKDIYKASYRDIFNGKECFNQYLRGHQYIHAAYAYWRDTSPKEWTKTTWALENYGHWNFINLEAGKEYNFENACLIYKHLNLNIVSDTFEAITVAPEVKLSLYGNNSIFDNAESLKNVKFIFNEVASCAEILSIDGLPFEKAPTYKIGDKVFFEIISSKPSNNGWTIITDKFGQNWSVKYFNADAKYVSGIFHSYYNDNRVIYSSEFFTEEDMEDRKNRELEEEPKEPFLGKVGEEINFDIKSYYHSDVKHGSFGPYYIFYVKDSENHKISFFKDDPYFLDNVKTVTCKVKSQDSSHGKATTWICKPKVKAIITDNEILVNDL